MVTLNRETERKKIMNLFNYQSPGDESSFFKGIPISDRYDPAVRALIYTNKFRIKYRGPRRKNLLGLTSYSGKSTCLKRHATSFAIY